MWLEVSRHRNGSQLCFFSWEDAEGIQSHSVMTLELCFSISLPVGKRDGGSKFVGRIILHDVNFNESINFASTI